MICLSPKSASQSWLSFMKYSHPLKNRSQALKLGQIRIPASKTWLSLILGVLVIWSLLKTVGTDNFLPNSFSELLEIFNYSFRPDLSIGYLGTVLQDALTTLAYAAAAMSLATFFGILGTLAALETLTSKPIAWLAQLVLLLSRSVHELVWALLLVQALGLSPWAGVLAIAIPYGGILGHIFTNQINDAPRPPLLALEAAGAGKLLTLAYGQVPAVFKAVTTYWAYRFECALRSAAVLSFVGLGGLGFRIEIALTDLNYAKAWTPIWVLIIMVVGFDFLSLRRSGQPEQ